MVDTKIDEEPLETREERPSKPKVAIKRKRIVELYAGEDRESLSRETSLLKRNQLTPLQSYCSTKNSPKNNLFAPFFHKPVLFPSNPNLSVNAAPKKGHKSQLSCNSRSALTQPAPKVVKKMKTQEPDNPKEALEENRDYLMAVLDQKPMAAKALSLISKLKSHTTITTSATASNPNQGLSHRTTVTTYSRPAATRLLNVFGAGVVGKYAPSKRPAQK